MPQISGWKMAETRCHGEVQRDFHKWLNVNGIKCSKCALQLQDGMGLRVVSTQEIQKGEVVIEVPDSQVLWKETASISGILSDLEQYHGPDQMIENLGLVLAVMYEATKGAASRWSPYIRMLPQNLGHMPMFWDSDCRYLSGTTVLEKLTCSYKGFETYCCLPDSPTQVKSFYHSHIKPLTRSIKVLNDLTDAYRKELYKWAVGIVSSYSFTLGEDKFLGMVPMWDMLNHITGKSNIRLHHCAKRNVLQMIATEAIGTGSEVINSYGDLPNSELLRRYGFVEIATNPNDCLEVSIWEIVEQVSSKDFPPEPSQARQRIKLLSRGYIYPQGGWFDLTDENQVAALTECLRVLTLSNAQFDSLQQEMYRERRNGISHGNGQDNRCF